MSDSRFFFKYLSPLKEDLIRIPFNSFNNCLATNKTRSAPAPDQHPLSSARTANSTLFPTPQYSPYNDSWLSHHSKPITARLVATPASTRAETRTPIPQANSASYSCAKELYPAQSALSFHWNFVHLERNPRESLGTIPYSNSVINTIRSALSWDEQTRKCTTTRTSG